MVMGDVPVSPAVLSCDEFTADRLPDELLKAGSHAAFQNVVLLFHDVIEPVHVWRRTFHSHSKLCAPLCDYWVINIVRGEVGVNHCQLLTSGTRNEPSQVLKGSNDTRLFQVGNVEGDGEATVQLNKVEHIRSVGEVRAYSKFLGIVAPALADLKIATGMPSE